MGSESRTGGNTCLAGASLLLQIKETPLQETRVLQGFFLALIGVGMGGGRAWGLPRENVNLGGGVRKVHFSPF